tara:strand:- start:5475 stop:6035 length:561 start_codon:yes stop_codon:yes gene_type:complete
MTGGKIRRCSFCKCTTHNIRTCPGFKEIIEQKADRTIAARKDILKRLEYYEFGPGSLVECEVHPSPWTPGRSSTRRLGVVGMVMDIHWSSITDISMAYTQNWHHQRNMAIKPIDGDQTYIVRLPTEVVEVEYMHAAGGWNNEQSYIDVLNRVKILSPSGATKPPPWFLDQHHVLKESKKWAKGYYL